MNNIWNESKSMFGFYFQNAPLVSIHKKRKEKNQLISFRFFRSVIKQKKRNIDKIDRKSTEILGEGKVNSLLSMDNGDEIALETRVEWIKSEPITMIEEEKVSFSSSEIFAIQLILLGSKEQKSE